MQRFFFSVASKRWCVTIGLCRKHFCSRDCQRARARTTDWQHKKHQPTTNQPQTTNQLTANKPPTYRPPTNHQPTNQQTIFLFFSSMVCHIVTVWETLPACAGRCFVHCNPASLRQPLPCALMLCQLVPAAAYALMPSHSLLFSSSLCHNVTV